MNVHFQLRRNIYRIDRGILEERAREKLTPVLAPSTMSVDEVAWQKWHKYVTNVIDINTRKVIWNHNGRGKSTLDAFFNALGKRRPRKSLASLVTEPGAICLRSNSMRKTL